MQGHDKLGARMSDSHLSVNSLESGTESRRAATDGAFHHPSIPGPFATIPTLKTTLHLR